MCSDFAFNSLICLLLHTVQKTNLNAPFCCCCVLHINRSGLNHTNQYPVIYVVANPVRSLLDRKKMQRNIYKAPQRGMKTKQTKKQDKNDKKKETITQSTCQKKNRSRRRSIERVWYSVVPAASHPTTFSYRNHAPKRIASTTEQVCIKFPNGRTEKC